MDLLPHVALTKMAKQLSYDDAKSFRLTCRRFYLVRL